MSWLHWLLSCHHPCAGSSHIPCRLDPCPRPLAPLCLWASPTAFLLTDSSVHTAPFCVSQVINGKPSPVVPILHWAPPACLSWTIFLRSPQSTRAWLLPDCLTLVSFCFLLREHLSPHRPSRLEASRTNLNLTLIFLRNTGLLISSCPVHAPPTQHPWALGWGTDGSKKGRVWWVDSHVWDGVSAGGGGTRPEGVSGVFAGKRPGLT